AAQTGRPRWADVEPGWISDAAAHPGAAARLADDSRTRRCGISPLRLDPPQLVSELTRGPDHASFYPRRSGDFVRRPDHGRRGLHRELGDGIAGWHKPLACPHRRVTGDSAADDDARCALPVYARGRPRAFPADERELRLARRPSGAGARQEAKTGAVRRTRVARPSIVGRGAQHPWGTDGPGVTRKQLADAAAAVDSAPPAVEDFLTHLAKERDVSPNTVIAYRRDLEEFVGFLGTYFGVREWSWQGLDRLAIRGFLAHLTRRKLNKRSIGRSLSAVRSFYKYLHRNDLVDVNRARGVSTPKQEKYLPGYLDRAQIELLFQSAELKAQEGRFADVRNCAILELFYSTGMRLSELRGINRMAIDLLSQQVKVRGQRRKERIVPLGDHAQ